MYLLPMRHHFQDYEQAEFDESKKLLAPMMNALCLVWSHSEYYNTPARIIVLLQEICNMLINMVSIYRRLPLSRIPRDSLKHFEISVFRHIRFEKVRKTIN